MGNGHALGLAITGTEITLLIVDVASRDVIARNRVALPHVDATLPEHLDRLVGSAPLSIERVAVACTDPAVQMLLTDRARQTNAPLWLAHATIISAAPALAAGVSSQFPGAPPLIVALLDHDGRPEFSTPLMLVDPTTGSVIDVAQARDAHLPAYEPAGADALADAMATLPVEGLGVDLVVAAGAGAEVHGVIQEISRASGLPVREIGGRYSVAFGAAIVAGGEQPIPLRGRSLRSKPSRLAVAVVGLSAALLVGGLAVAVAQHPDRRAPALSDSSQPVSSSSAEPVTSGPASATTSPRTTSPPPRPRQPSRETVTRPPSTTEAPTTSTTTALPPPPETTNPTSTTPRRNLPNLGRPPASSTSTERETSTPPIYTAPTRTTTAPTRTPTTALPDSPSRAETTESDSAPTPPS